MNRSLTEVGGGVLLVSQFTLLGRTTNGRRPSFDEAGFPMTPSGSMNRSRLIYGHAGRRLKRESLLPIWRWP